MTEEHSSEPTSHTTHSNVTKEGIDKQKSNKVLWITGIIIVLLVIALVTNGFGMFGKKNPSNLTLTAGIAPVLGAETAPVTIYEFSDFSCPYCAAAEGSNLAIISQLKSSNPNWEAPLPKIKSEYVTTGKVKIVFKYAAGHGTGQAAHVVAWCLNDQNLFWQFSDKAFANQADTGSTEKMKELAVTIGTNMTLLQSCLDSQKYNYLLQSDNTMANNNGVTGTPTFFVNGKKIEGAAPFSTFKQIIDAELAKSA